MPAPGDAGAELRRLLREVAARCPDLAPRAVACERELARPVDALATAPAARVMQWLRSAAQLAAAVEFGRCTEGARARARLLNVEARSVCATVATWTDDGRRTPP